MGMSVGVEVSTVRRMEENGKKQEDNPDSRLQWANLQTGRLQGQSVATLMPLKP